jgi:hypothetical protein
VGGLVWFDKTVQACQGPTSFIAYERGLVIFEYSHVFHCGGSLMISLSPSLGANKDFLCQYSHRDGGNSHGQYIGHNFVQR